MSHWTIGGLFLLAAPLASFAQETTAGAIEMPKEVVNATRDTGSSLFPFQAGSQLSRQTPGGVAIVDSRDFQQGRGFSFQELLQQTPGVYIQSQDGTEAAKISIRGSGIQNDSTSGVEFLLDGLPYNEGDGETDLEDFNLASIRSAEVYRGANALKYGGYTLGGAVNLIPFTGYDGPAAQLKVVAGSFGFRSFQASTSKVIGALDYFFSASDAGRDGYREHNRDESEKIFADLGWKENSQIENRFYLTLSRLNLQLPGSLTKEALQADRRMPEPGAIEQDFSRKWDDVRLGDKFTWHEDQQRLSAGAFWNYRDFQSKGDYTDDDPEGIQRYFAKDYGLSLDYENHGDLAAAKNNFSLGLFSNQQVQNFSNYANDQGALDFLTATGQTIATNVTVYSEIQHYLIADKLSAIAGIQSVYAKRDYRNRLPAALPEGHSDSQNYTGLNPKFGLLYEFSPKVQAFANYSHSYQPPSFDELTPAESDTAGILVFNHLRAQQAWTSELGIRGRATFIGWDIALYHSRLKDELLELNNARGRPLGTVNVPQTSHQGIELGFDLDLLKLAPARNATSEQLTLSGSYLLNDFRFRNHPVYHDNQIAGIPEHFARLELRYEHPDGYYIAPNIECNLSRYAVDQASSLFIDRYTLVGLEVGYRAQHGWSFFLEGKNLGDIHYPSTVTVIADARGDDPNEVFNPGDGRAFYAGATIGW